MIQVSVQGQATNGTEWLNLARATERAGFDTLYVADHPGTSPAPFVALAAAAAVTKQIRLGTCVLNGGRWDPVALGRELATLDLLSEGRAIFGVGAGHTPAEWEMVGLHIPPPPERVDRMIELVGAVRRLLSGERVTMGGSHLTLEGAVLSEPRPIQSPIPLMVGGNGRRLLTFAAGSADIVGVTGLGRTLTDGHAHDVDWSPAALNSTFDLIQKVADTTGRRPDVEALVQHVAFTDDPERVAGTLAQLIPGASTADILGSPFVWIGTPESIAANLGELERRWGINRYVVRERVLAEADRILGLLR
jgi:probable F420-dependent oxidoreductase